MKMMCRKQSEMYDSEWGKSVRRCPGVQLENVVRMRPKRRLAAAALAVCVTVFFPPALTAHAMIGTGPGIDITQVPDGYDEETWTKLWDNILEYDELPNLVKEFNPNLAAADTLFTSSMNDVEKQALAAYEMSEDFEDAAEELRDSGARKTVQGQIMYATLMAYEQQLGETGDQISRAFHYNSRESSNAYSGILNARKQLTYAAEQVMLGYDMVRAQKQTVEQMAVLYDRLLQVSEGSCQVGQGTELDVISAKKNVLTAENTKLSLENTEYSLKETLCLLTGWKSGDTPEILPVPEVDRSLIEAYDLAADTEKAVNNNYGLLDIRHEDSNGATTGVAVKSRTESEYTQKIIIEMETLYQTIQQKLTSCDAAESAYQSALITKSAAEIQYQTGSIGEVDYLGMQLSYLQAEGNKRTAELELRQAVEAYEWAREGILSLE